MIIRYAIQAQVKLLYKVLNYTVITKLVIQAQVNLLYKVLDDIY